jgi:hypothetical protein
MKVGRIKIGLLAIALLGSTSAFAGGSGENKEARQCVATNGSGSGFSYSYKNPGWDGKPCKKAVKVWSCKSSSCSKGAKGSDSSGIVAGAREFWPGYTPNSSFVEWN